MIFTKDSKQIDGSRISRLATLNKICFNKELLEKLVAK